MSGRSVSSCRATFSGRVVLLSWRSSDPGLGFAVRVLRGAMQRTATCSNTRCPRAGWLVPAGRRCSGCSGRPSIPGPSAPLPLLEELGEKSAASASLGPGPAAAKS